MSTITNKLTVSPSPHIKDKVTTSSLMLNVIIALVPAAVASVVIFGVQLADPHCHLCDYLRGRWSTCSMWYPRSPRPSGI